MSRKKMVLAHRGYRAKYPENTMLAFKKGFEYGADGVETDVQKTRDGKYVIIHDDTINRTAMDNKKGRVGEMSLKKLQAVDLGKKQTIPELNEFLAAVPRGKYVNIELKEETLKPSDGEELLGIFLKYVEKENLQVSSFEHTLLDYFKEQGITIGMLLDETHMSLGFTGIIKRVIQYRPQYINLPVEMFDRIGVTLSRLLIFIFRLLGCRIAFWTVNSRKDFNSVFPLGEIIITDEVELIIDELKMKGAG